MKLMKFVVSDVRFNPAVEAFEATAVFETTRAIVKVPARFAAPITAEFEWVAKGLERAALAALKDPKTTKSLQLIEDDALPLAA